jgi:hypothetical protein
MVTSNCYQYTAERAKFESVVSIKSDYLTLSGQQQTVMTVANRNSKHFQKTNCPIIVYTHTHTHTHTI